MTEHEMVKGIDPDAIAEIMVRAFVQFLARCVLGVGIGTFLYWCVLKPLVRALL